MLKAAGTPKSPRNVNFLLYEICPSTNIMISNLSGIDPIIAIFNIKLKAPKWSEVHQIDRRWCSDFDKYYIQPPRGFLHCCVIVGEWRPCDIRLVIFSFSSFYDLQQVKSLSRGPRYSLLPISTLHFPSHDDDDDDEENSGDGVYDDDDVNEGLGIGWLP